MSYPSSPQQPGEPVGGGGYPAGPPQPAGQPYSSYAEPAAPPPPKKSKALKIILIVLVSILVLCGAGVAVVWFTAGDEITEVVEASQTRLVTPETLAGRPKITDPELQSAADEMVTGLKTDLPDASSTIGAFYGDVEEQDLLMIAGASGVFADPEAELAEAVSETADMNLTNIKDVDAGPLGGSAKCADGGFEDVKVGYCAWADRGSVGIVVLYFATGAEAAAELVQIRSEVQQKV